MRTHEHTLRIVVRMHSDDVMWGDCLPLYFVCNNVDV